ncbi:hypothetical protein HanRHA438_Chr15g0715111 [Helianthus annuus]|uniref:Uncharacterized protein n=1 Tax=Helianthus annuus TaxID=4232 RepID=A0A251S6G3_HELAN|nr:hypothetical protein HanXRQr2_Chr15g0702731 [Helianthus annuus]KAJ0832046.1 hypothetical protein HanPSC8_Chr15g0674231 [Helianthus annuus]KAJ0845564.1 hypothetical protein HanRHA438_Chr15g0715111 [Helianthus annuus]
MVIYPFVLEIHVLRFSPHLLTGWMISWTIKSYVLYTKFRIIINIYLDHLQAAGVKLPKKELRQ